MSDCSRVIRPFPQRHFSAIAQRSILGIFAVSLAFCAPAFAGDLAGPALRTPLNIAKDAKLPGHDDSRLICSDDDLKVTMFNMQFDASTLGSGTAGDIACRWFEPSDGNWVEIKPMLENIPVTQSLEFVAPSPGQEPLLYNVLDEGVPADYEAALGTLTAEYGAPVMADPASAMGVGALWENDGNKMTISKAAGGIDMMTIELFAPELEKIALALY